MKILNFINKIDDLIQEIHNINSINKQETEHSQINKSLIQENSILLSEVEKLKSQIQKLKEGETENQAINVYTGSHEKTEKEIRLYQEIENLKKQIQSTSSSSSFKNTGLDKENKAMRSTIDDLLDKNCQLTNELENQKRAIRMSQNNSKTNFIEKE